MKNVIRHFEKVDLAFFRVAQVALLVMMVLTTVDAIARYLFNHAITGAYTFTEKYLMVLVVFFSMSYVMKMKGHIHIDFFTRLFPKKLKRGIHFIYMLLAAGLMFAIGYQSMLVTWEAYIHQYVTTGVIPWPTWLMWVWIPIGSYMFTTRLILVAFQTLLNDNEESAEDETEM